MSPYKWIHDKSKSDLAYTLTEIQIYINQVGLNGCKANTEAKIGNDGGAIQNDNEISVENKTK